MTGIKKKNKKLKVLSLFTGIGGMDLGFYGDVVVHKDSIVNKEFIDKQYTIRSTEGHKHNT